MIRRVLAPDTRERHRVATRALGSPTTVLDVGGRPGELQRFLPHTRLTTLNLAPPADVVSKTRILPFGDHSFDAVTSLDVLEHIAPEHRRWHLEELVRVARERVVVCCPLGTPEHAAAERRLAARRPHPFLAEHLANGLPTEEELRELVDGLPFSFELRFHGDFRRAIQLFESRPRTLLALLRQPDLKLTAAPTPWTNRAFLFGTLASTRRGR